MSKASFVGVILIGSFLFGACARYDVEQSSDGSRASGGAQDVVTTPDDPPLPPDDPPLPPDDPPLPPDDPPPVVPEAVLIRDNLEVSDLAYSPFGFSKRFGWWRKGRVWFIDLETRNWPPACDGGNYLSMTGWRIPIRQNKMVLGTDWVDGVASRAYHLGLIPGAPANPSSIRFGFNFVDVDLEKNDGFILEYCAASVCQLSSSDNWVEGLRYEGVNNHHGKRSVSQCSNWQPVEVEVKKEDLLPGEKLGQLRFRVRSSQNRYFKSWFGKDSLMLDNFYLEIKP